MPGMKHRLRWYLILAAFLLSTAGALAQQSSTSSITAEDLIKLTKEGLGDELIISMVKAAESVPRLTPDDVIALRKQGVSANVLTAVIQQQVAVASGNREKPAEEKQRRIHVTASLHPQDRSWWRMGGGNRIEQLGVTWSFRAFSWGNQQVLALPAGPGCPKDPLCKRWDPATHTCVESLPPDSEEWKREQACYAADKITAFGQEYEILDVLLPESAADAEIRPYYFSLENERLSWATRSSETASGQRVPGFVKLRLWGSDDFSLKIHLQLFISPNGFVQDFRVTECEVANRDQESLQRRLLSPERQYCSIVEAPN